MKEKLNLPAEGNQLAKPAPAPEEKHEITQTFRDPESGELKTKPGKEIEDAIPQ